MNKCIGHFMTITKHRHLVIKHCFMAGIGFQGLFHDLSKYMPSEFIYGCRFYQGNRSPNEGERDDHGFSYAWMHHKGRNKHHFEYWTDYDPRTKRLEPVKMPLRYVKEMFCDRVAASKIYLKDEYTDSSALEYYMKVDGIRVIHPQTAELIKKLLKMLADKGEDRTFAYIRKLKKY